MSCLFKGGAAALWALGLLLPFPIMARTIVVHPGESIRAALVKAEPGDRIRVLPGVYHEGLAGDLNALTISRNDIDLVGVPSPARPVVLENSGGQSYGIWVSPSNSAGPGPQADPEHPPCGLSGETVDGFSLSGFTVRGFAIHGVHLACVEDFALTQNLVDANGFYGLFPIVSRDGVISENEVRNTPSDAGVYVGQSDNVLIKDNRVHDNLIGVEVENSRHCAVIGNDIHGNTVGLLIDALPFLERKTQETTLVASNLIHDNNRPSTSQPGDLLGAFPPGIGILLIAANTTTVSSNTVTGNQSAGIGMLSLCLGLALLGQGCDGLDINPNPDGNRITGNFVRGNGTVPIPGPLDAFRGDLAWDGTGTANCWKSNKFTTSVPANLPICH